MKHGGDFVQRHACSALSRAKLRVVSDHQAIMAKRIMQALDAEGFPAAPDWAATPPIRFDCDWTGKNRDAERATEVRVLWSPENLYLKFVANYRRITVFSDSEPNGRRDELWERDVAEVFLQPSGSTAKCYKEFEVSPNGLWIDLDIDLPAGEKHDLQSGLRRRVSIDEQRKVWHAELTIPMKSISVNFDASREWRANFYRVEGKAEPRFYSAWRPTMTAQPNFHVPEAFGRMIFTE